ncbi:MAG: hypothetical protein ACFB9M_00375 [Myxococcota bacterium]
MTKTGERLISQLLEDPSYFKEKGLAYQLLSEVFAGHPLDDIRRLLLSSVPLVQHAGAFVASELGAESVRLLDELIPLARSADIYVRYNALEAIAVATATDKQEEFVHVLLALNDDDERVRRMAMRVASRVSSVQLLAAERGFLHIAMDAGERGEHLEGLHMLNGDGWYEHAQTYLLAGTSDLLRQYAAIAFKRSGGFDELVSSVEDDDVLDLWRSD